ncbi:Kelch repeat-containing protein [Streptomyces sp. NPDC058475]|uniref:Kelch repeat-containing protein n=1 Tax=Streptomyces sp. NPDC058475 TaxID=3346518 RepID=UPI003668A6EF
MAILAAVGALVGAVPAAATNGTVWTTLPSMPTPRADLAAAAAPCPPGQTGTCVYAVGGSAGGSTVADTRGTVESYNRLTNAWSTLRSLPTPRWGLGAATAPCPRGQKGSCIYAVGGNSGSGAVGVVESYNPATNAWSRVASLNTARYTLGVSTAPCPRGQKGTCIYAVGGNSGSGAVGVGVVESYNPATNAWSRVASLNTARFAFGASTAPCPQGQTGTCVYAAGGLSSGNAIGTVESYNPASNAWSPVTSLPAPRFSFGASAAPCPQGQKGTCIYAASGFDSRAGVVGTVESYNPTTNAWTTLPALPTPRAGLAAATTDCPPGETGTCVYAVGGIIEAGTAVGTSEALDPPATPRSRS